MARRIVAKKTPDPFRAAIVLIAALHFALLTKTQAAEPHFRTQQIAADLTVGYAVTLADMNGDKRPDIVVVDSARVVWYENPTWQVHTLIEGQTKRDNVCIAPYDIDGDGQLDFALGADWRPFDTRTGGTIQWLSRGAKPDNRWVVHPIGEEPMVHRMRWADLDGDGKSELIVVPLVGRNTTRPNFAEQPVRVLAFAIPKDPLRDRWTPRVINEDAHVTHNFWPTDFDGDGKIDILLASFEGVSLLKHAAGGQWSRTLMGAGNQATSPNRGASEVKNGKLAGGADYIATIEPWHGFQVVVYTRPERPAAEAVGDAKAGETLWRRQVLDEQLKWGHAVWCVDLDGDADQELIIGVRDEHSAEHRSGVRIYDPADAGHSWRRQLVDPGGVAVEDLAVGDLNGDGRADIVAVGRQTHNARIYWNEQ